jgi:hypothetical protein
MGFKWGIRTAPATAIDDGPPEWVYGIVAVRAPFITRLPFLYGYRESRQSETKTDQPSTSRSGFDLGDVGRPMHGTDTIRGNFRQIPGGLALSILM